MFLEIYSYAIEILLNLAVTIGGLLAIGFLFQQTSIMLIWLLYFFPLRFVAGGSHANSFAACLIISFIIGSASIWIAVLATALSFWMVCVSLVSSAASLCDLLKSRSAIGPENAGHYLHGRKALVATEYIQCTALIIMTWMWALPQAVNAAALGILVANIGFLARKR